MIEVKMRKAESIMITIEGHANYGPKGYDIVCASVSVLYQTLLLTLESNGSEIDRKEEINKQILNIRSSAHEVTVLVDSFFIGVKAIADEYPNNVKIV